MAAGFQESVTCPACGVDMTIKVSVMRDPTSMARLFTVEDYRCCDCEYGNEDYATLLADSYRQRKERMVALASM